MSKLKSLIVDDERLARRELRSLLSEFSEIEIVGEAESILDAINLIERAKPQIVFLDVQLAGETDFDLLEQIPRTFQTIFVTAFDEFAIRAFEVNALDYLLKPVNPARLRKTIEKLSKSENTFVPENFRPLKFDDRLFLELGERSIFLKINCISHILSANDYSEVLTIDGSKYLVEKSLREWEARLPAEHFTRIHRGAIINLETVERVENWFNRSYQIFLKNNYKPLTVSRRYAIQLKSKFS